ncbi:hypothetical protein AVEN_197425-1 [Araneus ventricosus]|uniref:Retrovirus-related Pol polyprotein from type-1 retrotransposable element R1 n=1 Tax=Araneus ventricosus TaxID=182803 RepID=A0A4Y2IBH1_ARAVE|nr:hypothetical protein AVEN_197425-1 [Araneus ventricosus]
MISLDIKGAFDHLQHTSIKNSLDNLKYHSNTLETLIDILSNRKVAINTSQGPATWNQQQGCPQGSCTGPAFWNLVANEVLRQDWLQGMHLQAFADDFVFLINVGTKQEVKNLVNKALKTFKTWTDKYKLEISLDKTNHLYINKNRSGPIYNKEKPLILHQGLKYIAGTSWRLSKNIRRQLYLTVVEKVILCASAAWAHPYHNITARQQKLLSSIQRKFLLNITGAYNTTPTAALQIIEGLIPLHVKAKMQSTLARIDRLGRNCDYEGIHFDHESYEQPSPPSTIHPAFFSLEDRISHGGQGPSNRTPNEVYTDGSKKNDQTDSAFCAIANEAITKTWKAKFSPANTVFQAEMLALKATIEWANTANEEVNIWSDSKSRLQALKSFNVKSKITQEAQMTLLENARIRLGWAKAHIGMKGNEIADTLAKEATTDGIPASQPAFHSQKVSYRNNYYSSHSHVGKLSGIVVRLADRLTAVYRKYLTTALVQRMHPISHWPWALPQLAQEIRFPFYRLLRMWGNRKSPSLRNEMPTYFILSLQGTKSTIHSPLEEDHPIQKTLKTKYRSFDVKKDQHIIKK